MNLKTEIQSLGTLSNDLKYQILCGKAGLFGKAFFGHKATKSEKAKLRYIWKTILNSNN
jgi:hypothetical protein